MLCSKSTITYLFLRARCCFHKIQSRSPLYTRCNIIALRKPRTCIKFNAEKGCVHNARTIMPRCSANTWIHGAKIYSTSSCECQLLISKPYYLFSICMSSNLWLVLIFGAIEQNLIITFQLIMRFSTIIDLNCFQALENVAHDSVSRVFSLEVQQRRLCTQTFRWWKDRFDGVKLHHRIKHGRRWYRGWGGRDPDPSPPSRPYFYR